MDVCMYIHTHIRTYIYRSIHIYAYTYKHTIPPTHTWSSGTISKSAHTGRSLLGCSSQQELIIYMGNYFLHLELRYYFEIRPHRKVIAGMFFTGDHSGYFGVGWPPGGWS